ETFMELDRALHFGNHPWELLHPLLGSPFLTGQTDVYYTLWYLILIVVVLWLAWAANRLVRLQFFMALYATLVLYGTGLAHLFPSAGPAFFGRVASTSAPDPYAPLMSHLAEVDLQNPLMSLFIQEQLWARYTAAGDW